ncbi:phosphatidate phosphatase LPIN1 isoform X2, partial [Silurus meridionalis]
MNYVGQLAGQVFVQVKELYRGLNPATLSGCIDVIVVRQPDGSLQCSPFHVRFGKMGVLRSREKVVDIAINGEPVKLHMKLGENGEAFFVKETISDMETVPSHLATSPIMTDGSALMESQMGKTVSRLIDPISGTSIQSVGPSGENGVKKRRKRRKKSKLDSVKRDENGDSEDEDMFPIDLSSDEDKETTPSRAMSYDSYAEQVNSGLSGSSYMQNMEYSQCNKDWMSGQRTRAEQTCTLSVSSNGGLSISCPQQSSTFPAGNSMEHDFLPSTPKSDSELLVSQKTKGKPENPEMLWAWGEFPQAAKPMFKQSIPEPKVVAPAPIPKSDSTHFQAITRDGMVEKMEEKPPVLGAEEAGAPASVLSPDMDVEAIAAGACSSADLEHEQQGPGFEGHAKTDSPLKRKDKRSHHLGSDGVYLDDLTELEPEVAALYFPKSEGTGLVRSRTEMRSNSQSPSSGMDSGWDSFSDQSGELPSIAISLCGGLTENRDITREEFEEKAVSYHEFANNPSIIDDPNLVVKIGAKFYNWSTAAPLVLAMQAFQKPLPKAALENIVKEKMPKKGGRWWFSWRGRNSSSKSVSRCCSVQINAGGDRLPLLLRLKDESSSSDDESRPTKPSSSCNQTEALPSSSNICYKKTLRLSSEELASLQLKEGPNDVVFSVTTQYQGTCRCEGTIYLWNWDDRIVISDIDGTITRSDTLGHILPTLGKDWTHQGIARLYHKVSQNGYKFMYCSARAIGMADMTRGYLHWVNERGTMLPQGPVLLSPSSLFSALHREVIEKKPEKFKIECLTDIKNLFHPNAEPFYAAFGNRATDVYSYKEVGVPLNRIFTVNPKGELIQEHAKTNISSYGRLCEVVDHVFPLLIRGNTSDFPCSDTYSQFTYWREQLPELNKHEQDVENS